MATLTDRETILLDAITSRLGEIHPVGVGGKQDRSMSDGGNGGQYRALQSDIENVRTEFHDFKTDVNLRFSEIATGIKGLETSLSQFFTKPSKDGGESSWLSGMFPALGIALTIAAAFGGVIKMNIDSNVTFAQERTTTAEKHLTDDLLTLTSVVRSLQETTIPRPELDSRIGTLDRSMHGKEDKDVVDQVIARLDGQITFLRTDIERMKGDIVTRRENESHWSDLSSRVAALADRINELARSTNGATLADQIKALQDQINSLLLKVPH